MRRLFLIFLFLLIFPMASSAQMIWTPPEITYDRAYLDTWFSRISYVDSLEAALRASIAANKAITDSAEARLMKLYHRIGIESYFNNGTPYWRSGLVGGNFIIGYFKFPGASAIDLPIRFSVIGQVESTSAQPHYIQIFDVTNNSIKFQIDLRTYTTNGIYTSNTVVNDIPTGQAIFALRMVMPASAQVRTRISAGVLEWY